MISWVKFRVQLHFISGAVVAAANNITFPRHTTTTQRTRHNYATTQHTRHNYTTTRRTLKIISKTSNHSPFCLAAVAVAFNLIMARQINKRPNKQSCNPLTIKQPNQKR
uniref:Secreted protein n=1 Tax=Cacopsylla melanoneura TaxID=428564 RepID=A0A8D8XDB1_9HEMI